MIHDPQHTLTHVSAEPPATVQLVFADGATFRLDLATTIRTHTALAALADPEVFGKARLDTLGGYVVWIDGDLEMAADNLRHLAVEQAGGIGHERLIEWVYRHHLTQVQAAEAIGISRRMLNDYLSGARPIPKTVWLACLGWESQHAA